MHHTIKLFFFFLKTAVTETIIHENRCEFQRALINILRFTYRLGNLQLQSEYGPESWRRFIPTIERSVHEVDQELKDVRNQIQQINWERKNSQLAAGEKLTNLENRFSQIDQ